jgi:hypothetical protein
MDSINQESNQPKRVSFRLGSLYSTPGALAALSEAKQDALQFIKRHLNHDWGDMCASDCKANDDAVVQGERIFSSYTLTSGAKLWVITEADRASTTLLLPDEY